MPNLDVAALFCSSLYLSFENILILKLTSAKGLITATQIAITQYDVNLFGNMICNGIVIARVTNITNEDVKNAPSETIFVE